MARLNADVPQRNEDIPRLSGDMPHLDGVQTDMHRTDDDEKILAKVLQLSKEDYKMKVKVDHEEMFTLFESMQMDANYAFEVATQ